jgi:hypothetical protein
VYEESPARARYGVEPHEVLLRWNDADPPAGISADDWQDERFAWYDRHFWLGGSEGALLPDVGFARADGELLVSWRQPTFPGPRRLLFSEQPGTERVEWGRAWGALRGFVDWVAKQVRERAIAEAEWARVESPLEEAARCTPEQFLDYVAPGGEGLLDAIGIGSTEHPESRPSLLALRDLEVSLTTYDEIIATTTLLDERGDDRSTVERLNELRSAVRMALNAERPETAGYDAARWLRSQMNLDSEPVSNDRLRETLASLADFQEITASSVFNSLAVGAREGSAATVVLLRHDRTRVAWAERMELARAIGHLLLDPMSAQGALGAASSRVACGPRRRRSGAFAAELLLPTESLTTMMSSEEPPGAYQRFQELMRQYGVGARTAAYHLWNQGYLVSEEDRDWLIEDYGRPDRDERSSAD